METLTIKTPADVLSFIGHTLGFWPQESLVCITLADNHVGATLRVDLPKPRTEISYAKMVAGYLSHDTSAEGVLFAVYTSEPRNGDNKPHASTIAALTGALGERGLTIREGLLVGDQTVSQYDGDPEQGVRLPLSATQSSQINAEFVYRGSTIEPTNRITLPASTKESRTLDAVESRVTAIQGLSHWEAMEKARTLWTEMLDAKKYPDDEVDDYSIITSRQFTHQELIRLCQRRDPNLDLPMFAASITRHRTLPTTEFTKYGLPPRELPALSSTLLSFAETLHKTTQNPSAAHNAASLIAPGNPGPGPELL